MEEEAKAQESSTDKNSGQKKPDDQQSDQSTLFIVKILRMFMTCCIPVVQPQTDSPYCTRRNSQCKFPVHYTASFKIKFLDDGFIIVRF